MLEGIGACRETADGSRCPSLGGFVDTRLSGSLWVRVSISTIAEWTVTVFQIGSWSAFHPLAIVGTRIGALIRTCNSIAASRFRRTSAIAAIETAPGS